MRVGVAFTISVNLWTLSAESEFLGRRFPKYNYGEVNIEVVFRLLWPSSS
jgi:hypothetical protein